MKPNSSGLRGTTPETAQREGSQGNLKSYIDGLKRVTNQKAKNLNKNSNLTNTNLAAFKQPVK